MKQPPRSCLYCQQPLFGRADKQFCDKYCRNAYHNNKQIDHETHIRTINRSLKKNRKILSTLCPEGKASVEKGILEKLNFDFSKFTSIYITSQRTYYFSYDYGFTPIIENEIKKVRIVKSKEYTKSNGFDPWKTS